ncbi:Signal-transduction histidine kinase senX3 [Planctomycetes bacterium Pla163]|uniref:histidine kinase n=1 Tax=Rohdeia mirabilis TaxID=2528008 RepID=A0A518D3S1_9BACT|nr:Signal-transduction histidine kinase senX3 [Planctomycetes bacterium Pla163]
MTGRRWSLAARLRVGFAIGAALLVAVPAVVNLWLVGRQAEESVDALVLEELHEFEIYVSTSGGDSQVLHDAVARLQANHSDVLMAFRHWDGVGTTAQVYGSPQVLDAVGSLPAPGPVASSHGAIRRRSQTLEDGVRVECAIDASEVFAQARNLQWTIGGVSLAAMALALCVAELLTRRTSSLLHDVAEGVRRHGSLRSPLAVELVNPPEEIREVVEELEHLVDRARDEDARTRLLISSLAHELRAPIQNLVLEGQVALMHDHTGAEYRELVENQIGLGRELADAVDNLVALCRNEDPTDAGPREHFDLGDELDVRRERWERSAARRGGSLAVTKRGDLRIVGDREAALRALRNLVANAVEWTAPGTPVEIELDGRQDAIEVRVHDRGPGIADADRERAFEPFVRLDGESDRRPGYGLGLSIVRRGAQRFGGEARLEPRAGGGTTAVLRLPRSQPA